MTIIDVTVNESGARRQTCARVLAAACVLLAASTAPARVFVVDSVLDELDAVRDGVCATAAGACTLRAAISEANGDRASDTIVLPAGTYVLTIPPADPSVIGGDFVSGDLDVLDHLKIRGAGADLTIIDADQLDRVFEVTRIGAMSFSDPVRFRVQGVSIVNGNPPQNHGGGIFSYGADVRLKDTVVAGNQADLGGGIDCLSGRLKAVRSRIADNVGRRCCGGIRAIAGARIELDRTAVSENRASGPQSDGGGIYCFATSELKVSRSTLTGNRSTGSGGGLVFYAARGKIRRTTIQGNVANGSGGGISMFHTDDPTSTRPIPGPLLIQDSYVIENVADDDGDGLGGAGGILVTYPTWLPPSPPVLMRTTVAGNVDRSGLAPDCSGELRDGGGNTLGDTTSCLLWP